MMKHSYEEVFQLFMEKISGNLTPEEEIYVEKMLVEDPSFSEVWYSLTAESAQLKANDFLARINVQTDLDTLKNKLVPNNKPANKIFPLKKLMAVAAVFLLILTPAYFLFFKNESIKNKEQIAAIVQKNKQVVSLHLADGSSLQLSKDSNAKTISLPNASISTDNGTLQYSSSDTMQNLLSVPEGENYKIVLSDGTEVWLNAATSLRFPFLFHGRQREVYVEGEAFFKVAKDAAHPFIVHTGLTQVQVLGTSFNVNTYSHGNVKTSLVEGKVLTRSNDGKSMELKPGYAAGYDVSKGFVSGSFDEDEELSWLKGVYYFHNIPVTDLAVIASRCYGIKIELDKKSLSGISITGLLDIGKLPEFLSDLEIAANIKYYYAGNKLYLK